MAHALHSRNSFRILLLIGLLVGGSLLQSVRPQVIPVTRVTEAESVVAPVARITVPQGSAKEASLSLSSDPGALVSVTVANVLSLPVEQQPAGQPGYVSTDPDVATQFSMAAQYGTVGLLAHNNLAWSK